eukprot:2231091-Prymnesium_polylepis.1
MDGKLAKGRTLVAHFPDKKGKKNKRKGDIVTYTISDVATDSVEGDPSLNMQGPTAKDNHWASMTMIVAGPLLHNLFSSASNVYSHSILPVSYVSDVGQFKEKLTLAPLSDRDHDKLSNVHKDGLKAELHARKLKYGDKKPQLLDRLWRCFQKARLPAPSAAEAAAAEAADRADTAKRADAAAVIAAAAAAVAAVAALQKKKWLSDGSEMRTKWNQADGFAGMKHRSLFVGGSYRLGVLHAVELRFTGSLWARFLRLARLIDERRKAKKLPAINVFAKIQRALLDAGLHLVSMRDSNPPCSSLPEASPRSRPVPSPRFSTEQLVRCLAHPSAPRQP